MSGWNPPPQQPGHGGQQPPYGQQPQQPYGQPPAYGGPGPYGQQQPYGQPTPPPFGQPGFAPQPPRRSKAPLLLAIGGGVLVLVIIAAVAVFAMFGGDKYTLTTPASAGGYPKVTGAEDDQLAAAFKNGVPGATTVYATYDANGTKVIFFGAYSSRTMTDSSFKKGIAEGLGKSGASITYYATEAGGPGKAECAEIKVLSNAIPMCYWNTDTSVGSVMAVPDAASVTSGGSLKTISWSTLSEIMRKIRPDVESKA